MPNRSEVIDGQDDLVIQAGQRVRIGAASDTAVGTHLTLAVGANQAVTVQGESRLKVGRELKITARKVTVQASDQLELTCGDARIVLHRDGRIEIVGQDLTLEARGKLDVKGSADAVIKGGKLAGN